MKLLYIEWDDSAAFSSWHSHEEARELKPVMCRSVGWQYSVDKKYLHLAATCTPTQYADIVVIPRGCVTKKVVLTLRALR